MNEARRKENFMTEQEFAEQVKREVLEESRKEREAAEQKQKQEQEQQRRKNAYQDIVNKYNPSSQQKEKNPDQYQSIIDKYERRNR